MNGIDKATFIAPDGFLQLDVGMRQIAGRPKLDMRQLVRHYVLIAANAGLRTGEQQQLRWCDVKMRVHAQGAALQSKLLAEIYVRKETSKVRKDRKLYCRGGYYFERWKELSKHTSSTDLIFSLDGKTRISNRAILYHFHRMVKLAGIGASESYVRKLRSARTEPSLGAVAICASRLMNAAEQLRQRPRYQSLAEQLAAMSIKCRALVDADSVEFDLA